MKKTVIALGLAALVVMGVSYASAGGPGFGPGKGPGNCTGFFGVSNLTSEQQTQLQDLRQTHYNEIAPLRERMFSLRQELQALWADPKADPQAIRDKENELTELRNQMRDKAIQFKLEARNYFTPEQIASFGSGCGRGGRGYGRGPF
ncbi:MAG: periplasmic heavy metal sensor [Deltaproteobacteria bacterium]|nr:MAG: periplasmic heavy metal sensor [Deltaproteobacteria bacterium]